MIANKLKMNTDKTEIMFCGTTKKLKDIGIERIKISDDFVDFSHEVKDLGILIDQNISFNSHVSYLRKCCYAELRKISSIRPFIEEKSAVQLCVSLILSKLDYCNCLFYGMTKENFYKLQLVQNHAACLDKRSSAKSLLKELPVEQRVDYEIALIVFKCLNIEDFPSYLKDLIQVYTPSRSLRSADKLLLTKPITKLKVGERSFCYFAPVVWNKLPFELRSRSCTILPTFKKYLKTNFFRIAFE